jgi:hypothetical protein
MAKGWTTEGSKFESRYDLESSLLHIVLTGSEVHPSSNRKGIQGSFPGGNDKNLNKCFNSFFISNQNYSDSIS